ncbi:MAG: hypothetical protein L6R42_003530, partial [Xanthoria sp. 1 TBL-2021]
MTPRQLLRSPAFHRMVRGVHKRVREMRHGPDLEEMGGTKIDGPESTTSRFLQHFKDEIRDQLRGNTTK